MKTKRFLAWFLTLAMLCSLIPGFGISFAAETGNEDAALFADEPTVTHSDTKENTNQAGGIVYTKTSTAKDDGTVDITLTAHTTGEVKQLTAVSPTDIVLVLDVSGSMDENYTTTRITGYNEVTGGRYTYTTGFWFWEEEHTVYGMEDTDNYYINIGTAQEPKYTRVTYTGRDSNGFEMYEYSSGNTEVIVYPVLNNVSATPEYSYDVVQFYSVTTETQTVNKMVSLRNAVNSFIDTTAQMNEGLEANQMHNISIVKFADNSYYNSSVPTVTEGNHKGAGGYSNYNYSEVVKNLTPVDAAGATALKTAVSELSPGGATAVDYGLNLAQAVLMNRSAVAEENAVDRNEVVIVFTDGLPTYESEFSTTVANNAISIAGNMESTADVTVYGVCIATNADATDTNANINRFMHYMTSNFPNATSMTSPGEGGSIGNGYYMTPDSSTSLLMIFESIIQKIDHPTVIMGEEAAMVDTISPYFDFKNGEATNVTLQTSARNADGTWAAPVDDANLSAVISGDRLTVNGFDFDANFISDVGRGDNGDFYGKQLIVTFTVIPDYGVIDAASATLMDGILPTNSGFASLVDSDYTPAAEVETPELSAHQVTYKVDGDEYSSYNRFTGSAVEVDAVPQKEGYTFSGWSYPDGVTVSDGKFVMPDEDVEITGTFTVNTYNVKYQYSNNELAQIAPELPASHTEQYGSTVTVAPPADLPGYVFIGWYPLQTDVDITDEGTFIMPAKDVTLVGYFEENTNTYYRVEHYLQNTEGTDYDLDGAGETRHGTTGDEVSALAKEYPGFTYNEGISAPSGKILGDGSLTLKFYYDRNTNNITYVYEGMAPEGAPSAPNAVNDVRYGTEITVAESPDVPGYTFSGWETSDATINDGKFNMPDKDVVLKGSFASNKAGYSVNYWLQNLDAANTFDPDDYTLSEQSYDDEAYVGQLVQARNQAFAGFSLNVDNSKIQGHVTVDRGGSGTLVLNLYYDRHTYNVTYGYYGEQPETAPDLSDKNKTGVRYGTVLDIAEKPVLDGYVFDGWYTRTADVVNSQFTMPDHDVTFLGLFNEQYTVSYDLNGGTGAPGVTYADESVLKDTVVSLKAEPTRTDYIFTGWSNGASIYQPGDDYTVAASVKFTAQWDEDKIGENDPDNGDDIADKYQKKIVFKIVNGTWDGTSADDLVYVVSLRDDNGNYSADGTADISGIIPTGMVVNNGYEEPGEWREVPPASVSGTETATYVFIFHKTPDVIYDEYKEDEPEPTVDEYNINEKILVDPNGGIWNFNGTDYTEIQTITLTDNIDLGKPTRTGYMFMGWKYSAPTPEQEAENIKGIYTAQWEKDEIGKDNPDEGDGIADKYQKKITFKIVNGEWSNGTTDDIVAVVDLKDENGNYSASGSCDISTLIPTGMSADSGYKNGKWNVEPPTTVSGADDATYTYSYTKSSTGGSGGGGGVTKYTLTYETNGGSAIGREIYSSGKVVKLTKIPSKANYVFEGWYEDKDLTKYVDEVKMTKNIIVYAKWVEDNGSAGSGYDTPGSLNSEDHFAYVVGYPDGTVRPNDNISRAEVTSIFFRLLNPDELREKNLTSDNDFSDVNAGDWYNTSISTMAKLGIVKGRAADSFVPDAFITRAEFAAICARFDNSEYEVVDDFTDVGNHWAEDEIHEAAAHGWIRGYEDGTFKPDQYITRAEAMTMINRVLNRVPESCDDLLESMVKWPDNSDESVWYYLAVQEATNSHDYKMKNHIYEKWTALREASDWTKYE